MALDHGDPGGERAPGILTGEETTCIDILDAWSRHKKDPRLLSAMTRGVGDTVYSETEPSDAERRYQRRSEDDPMDSGEEDLACLAGLGHEVSIRLVASVTYHLLHAPSTGSLVGNASESALVSSLFGRAACALNLWLGGRVAGVDLKVVEMSDARISEFPNGSTLDVCLPLNWIYQVWGRDLAVVNGRFALGILESTAESLTLATIDPDFHPAPPITVARS